MSKISSILLGIVFIGMIAGGFGIFLNALAPEDVSTSDFDAFSQSDAVSDEMTTLKDNLEDLASGGIGILDIIGLLFSSAYSSAKLLFFNSISLVAGIVTGIFANLNLNPQMATLFISSIITMVLIVIVARIVLSTIFKRET